MKNGLPFFFLLLPFFAFSQDSIPQTAFYRYYKFLRYEEGAVQNHYVSASWQFMYSPAGTTFGAKGMCGSVGINLARFFSRKLVIGVVEDIKIVPGFWKAKIPDQLRADFNEHFIPGYGTSLDSNNAYVIKSALNGGNGQSIFGNNVFRIGGMISIFPQRYGGIMLKATYGGTDFQVHGVYGNPYINNGGNDKVALSVSDSWSMELSLKPYAFFDNAYVEGNGVEAADFGKSIVLSLYYERVNFRTAEFNGTYVRDMVTPAFMEKYGLDHRFGFKIGFAFY